MFCGMTTERVTVSLPSEIKQAAQRVARAAGVPFSAVVNEAVASWLRTRLVHSWLSEYQEEQGVFDEEDLRKLAAESGVPYLPPGGRTAVA